ncbi:MAG: hypothetical protein QXP52_02490 [Candidatus Aenigmatarchaeota archaeon]
MIKILSDKKLYAKIESEKEKLIFPLIIEKGDLVEMKIVRNVFSRKDGKKIDRIETYAKIRVEKINIDKLRIIGRIEELCNERVSKGFHGEDIDIGSELFIEKKSFNEEILRILEKIDKIRMEKIKNFEEIINKNQNRFFSEKKKVEEFLEFGMVEKLFVCKEKFYENLNKIKKALEKNAEIIIVDNKDFCEKIKIAVLLRFAIY